jgi:hypothetical protein
MGQLWRCSSRRRFLSLQERRRRRCSDEAAERESYSSYMWCLEMQRYPAAPDARLSGDVKQCEHYRSEVEQYEKQRTLRDKRDQEIRDKLNRDPTKITR